MQRRALRRPPGYAVALGLSVLLGLAAAPGRAAPPASPSMRAATAAPFAAVDDLGARLRLPAPPRRIVSLAPGATEMLFAAGAGGLVIGTAEYSDIPEAARRIRRIGDAHAVDVERIVALRPDVVVAWPGGNPAPHIERLERLGVPVYRHRIATLADLPGALRRLGALAGTAAQAERAARRVERRLHELEQRYGGGRPATVLLQVWGRPVYTVGGRQPMSDALRLCGVRNAFGDLQELSPVLSVEAVIARDPEIIVAASPPGLASEWLADWRRYAMLSAVRTGRLVAFEDQRLGRLGPSVLDATEGLCRALNP